MEFRIINLEGVTEKDLLSAIKDNAATASLCREQIRKMKAAAAKTKKVIPTPITEEIEVTLPVATDEEDVDDFEGEVDYYLSQLKDLTAENIDELIEDSLPVSKKQNARLILLRLKLESLRNLRELNEVLEDEDLTEEDLIMFKDEAELEKKKISYIDSALSTPEQATHVQGPVEQNRLIFVPTISGNIRILDEVSRLTPDYYEGFLELFDSIKDGTFKRVKRFTNNNALNGVCEVKGPQMRVVFARLNHNTYALITAFIKKCDNDNGYNSTLKQKVADYRAVADQLKASLSNPDFMYEQRNYEIELYRSLGVDLTAKPQFVKEAK